MAKPTDPLELAARRAQPQQQQRAPDTRTQGGPRAPFPGRPQFNDPTAYIADSLERIANAVEFIAAYLAEGEEDEDDDGDDGDGERDAAE